MLLTHQPEDLLFQGAQGFVELLGNISSPGMGYTTQAKIFAKGEMFNEFMLINAANPELPVSLDWFEPTKQIKTMTGSIQQYIPIYHICNEIL